MYLEAIEYWKKAAAAGDAGYAYRLSKEYFNSKIVRRDVELAISYLIRQLTRTIQGRCLIWLP